VKAGSSIKPHLHYLVLNQNTQMIPPPLVDAAIQLLNSQMLPMEQSTSPIQDQVQVAHKIIPITLGVVVTALTPVEPHSDILTALM